ncbi:uncharacterized protein [Henckelia pumila]|uniref:uncharacterized protein n=1 Tax=Henckelia pumila TaxID=405737 RepID=UPI003C6E5A8E
MARSLHSWKTREVVVQIELTPSIELILVAQEESDWRKELLGYMEKAETLARITKGEVLKFLWKNIVCIFGVPRKLISNNGQQFQGARVQAWSLVQSLKIRLGKAQGNWVDELSSLLWSYRTMPRIRTGETPFSLEDLDFMEEKREAASIRMEAYKNRIARSYNRRVRRKGFQVGDLVLRRVQDVTVRKLDPKWEGPYKVVMRLSSDAYYLEDSKGKMLKRPWSAYNLRKYYS